MACALHRCGHEIISVASRSLDSLTKLQTWLSKSIDDIACSVDGSDVVFLTAPDGAIKDDFCKVISSEESLNQKFCVPHKRCPGFRGFEKCERKRSLCGINTPIAEFCKY